MRYFILFFLLFAFETLQAKEQLIVAFDKERSSLLKTREDVQKRIEKGFGKGHTPVVIERIGDRYVVAVKNIEHEKQKEKLLATLALHYPHIFSIEQKHSSLKPISTLQQTDDEREGMLEWFVIVALTLILFIWFTKGVVEMLRVRRSQRFMRHQQLEMEKELKKEFR